MRSMKRLMMLLVAVLLACGTVAAKDIRIAVTVSVDPSLSRSRTTAIFHDYLETIPGLDLIVTAETPNDFLADPETDVWVLVTVIVTRSGYAIAVYTLNRLLINAWLELGWLKTIEMASPETLRSHWRPGLTFAAASSSLEAAIGEVVDFIDEYLETSIRPNSTLY